MTPFQKGVMSESDWLLKVTDKIASEILPNFADSLDTTNTSSGKIVISL
jgi:hypothetical protein